MEVNNNPSSPELIPPKTTESQVANSHYNFVGYFLWLMLSGTGIWTLIQLWNEPFIHSYTIVDLLINAAIIVTVPSLISAILLAYENRKAIMSGGLILVATVGIIIIAFFNSGEGALGVLIYSGFIIVAFVIAIVVTGIAKIAIKRWSPRVVHTGGIILILIIFSAIGIRLTIFSASTSPASCMKLNVYGRSDCFESLAEKTKEAHWCFGIETDSKAPYTCLQKVGAEGLSIESCNQLNEVGLESRSPHNSCIRQYMTLKGTLSDCESTVKNYMRSRACIDLILQSNKNSGETSDCSVFTDPNTKMQCYASWQRVISNISSYESCKTIVQQAERDICYFSFFYGTAGISGSGYENICKNIQGSVLRNQCLDTVKKLRDVSIPR